MDKIIAITAGGVLTPLESAFVHAASLGYKRVTLAVGTLRFSLAPATGRNPNAVYVKTTEGTYLGKLMRGCFMPVWNAQDNMSMNDLKRLREVAMEPMKSAIAWGQKTGACAICGRTEKLGFSVPKHNPLDDL